MRKGKDYDGAMKPTEDIDLEATIIDLAYEGWRLGRRFERALGKLDAGEASPFANQILFYDKRIGEALATIGLRLVTLEGQSYDAGMPVTALNVDAFAPEANLLVDRMVEPVVMSSDGVRKPGVVLVRELEP